MRPILAYVIAQSGRALDGLLCLRRMSDLPDDWQGKDGTISAEIDETLAASTGRVRFSPGIERLYVEATRQARERFFFITSLLGAIVYNLFLFVNALILGDQIWLTAAIHLGVVTPIATGFLVAVMFNKADPGISGFIVLNVMTGGIIVVMQGLSGEVANLYMSVVVLIVIGANLLLALSLPWALAFTIIANVAIFLTILTHPGMTPHQGLFIFVIIAVSSVYSLIGNYRIDAGVRIAFLHALMERLRADQLALTNQRLETLADIDGLTGVGNRRSFDKAIDRLWTLGAAGEPRSVALLLIDIDRFKLLNDTHGHLTGDACLRHVARILTEKTGGDHTHLARYGGEEFTVLIMPGGIDDAYDLAERLRIAIESRPVVIDTMDSPVSVTVSIGCAAIVPGDRNHAVDLIAAADGALYLAKATGRNQTMIAGLSAMAVPANPGRRLAS